MEDSLVSFEGGKAVIGLKSGGYLDSLRSAREQLKDHLHLECDFDIPDDADTGNVLGSILYDIAATTDVVYSSRLDGETPNGDKIHDLLALGDALEWISKKLLEACGRKDSSSHSKVMAAASFLREKGFNAELLHGFVKYEKLGEKESDLKKLEEHKAFKLVEGLSRKGISEREVGELRGVFSHEKYCVLVLLGGKDPLALVVSFSGVGLARNNMLYLKADGSPRHLMVFSPSVKLPVNHSTTAYPVSYTEFTKLLESIDASLISEFFVLLPPRDIVVARIHERRDTRTPLGSLEPIIDQKQKEELEFRVSEFLDGEESFEQKRSTTPGLVNDDNPWVPQALTLLRMLRKASGDNEN